MASLTLAKSRDATTPTRRYCSGLEIVTLAWLLLLALQQSTIAYAFYVPGAAETSYKKDAIVTFNVNSLRSSSEMFPIDFTKMPFCQAKSLEPKTESLGELIWGDRMYDSLYTARMLQNCTCLLLPDCDTAAATARIREARKSLTKMIDRWYRVYMNVDNLPVFTMHPKETLMARCASKLNKDISLFAQRGFPLGVPAKCSQEKETLLNNHLDFIIHYNTDSKTTEATPTEERRYIVVSIEVIARSIAWKDSQECASEPAPRFDLLEEARSLKMSDLLTKNEIYWTYSVQWRRSDVRWATRWDNYLNAAAAAAPASHVLFIVLSLMIVLFIGSAVMGVLLRALHKDFNRYNSENPEDLQEEVGWKLIHADVFRSPFYANWLAVFVANGCQVLSTAGVVLVVALMGFLSPSRRGALVSALLLTVIFTSVIGGYVCGVLLQYLNCRAWKHLFTCSLSLTGVLLIMYLFIEVVNKVHGASTAVPFTTLLQLLLLFVAVSLPLTLVGGSFAFRQQPMSNPTLVGRLAREIPTQMTINKPLFMYAFWPTVPLLVALIELYYIMQDLWEGQIYYSFGFLAITASIWVLVCALVTVSCLYYVLCYENHQWWWIAYMVPGGGGVHIFIMATLFFFARLSVSTFASGLLYFVYMAMVSYMYGMAAGAVGVIVSIIFVRRIYGSIKID